MPVSIGTIPFFAETGPFFHVLKKTGKLENSEEKKGISKTGFRKDSNVRGNGKGH